MDKYQVHALVSRYARAIYEETDITRLKRWSEVCWRRRGRTDSLIKRCDWRLVVDLVQSMTQHLVMKDTHPQAAEGYRLQAQKLYRFLTGAGDMP